MGSNNWSAELERRRSGEVPGFIGNDESVEDFAAREQRYRDELVDEHPAADVPMMQGGVIAEALDKITPPKAVPVKRAGAKKATATRPRAKKR